MLMAGELKRECQTVDELPVVDLGVLPVIHWYAVRTHPGREAEAERELLNQNYACFHPLRLVEVRLPGKQRRLEKVKRSLYPRYVFAGIPQIGPGQKSIGSISYTRGVADVLGNSLGPTRIPREVMDKQLRRANRQGVVEVTEVPAEHLFTQGQVVGFREESLWSPYTGTISSVDSGGNIEIWIEAYGNYWPVNVHYSELLPPESG